MKKEFTKKGKCIWCLNEKPTVSFFHEPHTISRQLGAKNIGFDICDSCNSYFGTNNKSDEYPMNVELAFKEIFNVIKHLLPNKNDKPLKSIYFNYYKSKNTFQIKSTFKYQLQFINMFTRQFKRGIYETFLQEYHLNTGNGLDTIFDKVREFVRYDKCDIPLYFIEHNGIIVKPTNDEIPSLTFNDILIKDINEYGFYTLFLFGFWFYLEVTPRAELSRDIFLKNEYIKRGMPNPILNGIKRLNYITELDFTLKKLKNS